MMVYGRLFARIAEVYLSTLSRKVDPFGLDRYFIALLFIVENSGEITQKQLRKFLRKDKVTAMRMVNYLCERGFVARKINRNDKREQFLTATNKAKKIVPMIVQSIQETNAILFSDFDNLETKEFERLIAKMMITMEKLPEPDFIIRAEKKKTLTLENEE